MLLTCFSFNTYYWETFSTWMLLHWRSVQLFFCPSYREFPHIDWVLHGWTTFDKQLTPQQSRPNFLWAHQTSSHLISPFQSTLFITLSEAMVRYRYLVLGSTFHCITFRTAQQHTVHHSHSWVLHPNKKTHTGLRFGEASFWNCFLKSQTSILHKKICGLLVKAESS